MALGVQDRVGSAACRAVPRRAMLGHAMLCHAVLGDCAHSAPLWLCPCCWTPPVWAGDPRASQCRGRHPGGLQTPMAAGCSLCVALGVPRGQAAMP